MAFFGAIPSSNLIRIAREYLNQNQLEKRPEPSITKEYFESLLFHPSSLQIDRELENERFNQIERISLGLLREAAKQARLAVSLNSSE